MTGWGLYVFAAYVVLFVLAARRMRRANKDVSDLLVFAINTAATAWLLFLYLSFSSDGGTPEQLKLVSPSWTPWLCLAFAILLVPGTIRGALVGTRLRQTSTPQEKAEIRNRIRRELPKTAVTLIIGAFWLIFLGSQTYGFDRSNCWALLLGIGASVALGWVVVALIEKRQRRGPSNA